MADASPARLVGTTFAGKFRVVQFLRTGGIAHVYTVEPLGAGAPAQSVRPAAAPEGAPARGPHRVSSRPPEPRAPRLALKVLREELRDDRAIVRRFERGAAALGRIAHPNVVRMKELERLPDGLPYCTMELLIGLDLADALAAEGRLDPRRAVGIADGVAAGLAAAHQAGVMHLDVKPENIFLVHRPDGSEQVKLLDFGLASIVEEARSSSPPAGSEGARDVRQSLSRTSWLPRVDAACSTPEYMAPEQRRGVPPAPAMDVYALGVVLHEMLAGHPPGSASGVQGPDGTGAQSIDLPAWLAPVVERALARDPSERFASMVELRAALLASLDPGGSRRRWTSGGPSRASG